MLESCIVCLVWQSIPRNFGKDSSWRITSNVPSPSLDAGKRATKPIQETAWFITVMVLIAVILIALLIMILWTRHRGTKYLGKLLLLLPKCKAQFQLLFTSGIKIWASLTDIQFLSISDKFGRK